MGHRPVSNATDTRFFRAQDDVAFVYFGDVFAGKIPFFWMHMFRSGAHVTYVHGTSRHEGLSNPGQDGLSLCIVSLVFLFPPIFTETLTRNAEGLCVFF